MKDAYLLKEFATIINSRSVVKWEQFFTLVNNYLIDQDPKKTARAALIAIVAQLFMKVKNTNPSQKRTFGLCASDQQFNQMTALQSLSDYIRQNPDMSASEAYKFTYDVIAKIVASYIAGNIDSAKSWKAAGEVVSMFDKSEMTHRIKIIINPQEYIEHVARAVGDIQATIKFMNLLGPAALAHTARLEPIEAFKNLLGDWGRGEDPKYKEEYTFIRNLQEIQAIILLAQTWGLQGGTEFFGNEVSFNGSSAILTYDVLQEAVQELRKKGRMSFIEQVRAQAADLSTQDIQKIVDMSIASLRDVRMLEIISPMLFFSPAGTKKYFAKDEVFLFLLEVNGDPHGATDYDRAGHAVAIGILNGILCYINRGYEFTDEEKVAGPGIKIYEITPAQKSKIIALQASEVSEQKVKEVLTGLKLQHVIPMKEQYALNCAFVAAKSIVWCAFYLNALKVTSDHNLSQKIANAEYKLYTARKRIAAIQDYLNVKSTLAKDPLLLARVYNKARQPQWQARGLDSIMPMFEALPEFAQVKTIANDLIIMDTIFFLEKDHTHPYYTKLIGMADKLIATIVTQKIPVTDNLFNTAINKVAIEIAADDSVFNHNVAILKSLAENYVLGRNANPRELFDKTVKADADEARIAIVREVIDNLSPRSKLKLEA